MGKIFGFVCHLVTLETIPLEMNCIAELEHVPWKPGKKNSPVQQITENVPKEGGRKLDVYMFSFIISSF